MAATRYQSSSDIASLRNVAIIAHVDHGKTTLVDNLLKQSGNFRAGELEKLEGGQHGLILDSNDLERERGITILSKNCAVNYHALDDTDYRINIIDTPGHADFGGEVERVLQMADGCILVVDAYEGPMPQTRFVLGKALENHLKPLVVINKCDRPDGDPDRVIGEVFDLLVALGADDDALDFPVVYASARDGWALDEWNGETKGENLQPVFEAIVKHVPHPDVYIEKPLRMQVTTLGFSEYVGRIGVGRVFQGTVHSGQPVVIVKHLKGGKTKEVRAKIGTLEGFEGLSKVQREFIGAGDLCAISGLGELDIGDTICDPDHPEAMDEVAIDEPTISMAFRVNDSPFAGNEGEFVTSRQIKARLERELEHNVALRVEPGRTMDEFIVSGRGLLHLGILLETMRREGFELAVGRPIVIERMIDGVKCEPLEELVVDVPDASVGGVMQIVGERKGEIVNVDQRGDGMTHCVFKITSRALIGMRGRVLTATQGEAIMHHTFLEFIPVTGERPTRHAGVMISTESGQVTGYAVENLHERGVMMVRPGDKIYAGQVVGEHNRGNDIEVNAARVKKLDNMRSANKDATVTLKQPKDLSLEQALEYIEDDELVELTPQSIRIRKVELSEAMRKRAARQEKAKANA
ncbi:MAG: translational GTPase TypA [Phycisphaerae bacterium]|nr:translational GTPase TypA [Phycisphaerae bacterium]MBM91281.1 translational GTPase TypA [Phycisphaerae bacterium]